MPTSQNDVAEFFTLYNSVVDLSHLNVETIDFAFLASVGIRAVIHKATEGLTLSDPKYKSRREQAVAVGLLWGAYHFGRDDDGQSQAEHFLNVVDPASNPNDLLVLDFEQCDACMTIASAENFVAHVQTVAGKTPGLYATRDYLATCIGTTPIHYLQQCWLWMAHYSDTDEPRPPSPWNQWRLWQYTDNSDSKHLVGGVGKWDRSCFNGGIFTLDEIWANQNATAGNATV